jgi:hypothetical protein
MDWKEETESANKISEWIAKGARKVLPKGLVSRTIIDVTEAGPVYSETQIVEDIVQAVWVNLLETNRVNSKDGFNQGREFATTWCRKELKTMPLSQMDLPTIGEDGDDPEEIAPWDKVKVGSLEQVPDAVMSTLEQFEEEDRTEALELLKVHKPDDYLFIVSYLEDRRVGKPYSREETDRAKDIKRWLSRK